LISFGEPVNINSEDEREVKRKFLKLQDSIKDHKEEKTPSIINIEDNTMTKKTLVSSSYVDISQERIGELKSIPKALDQKF
jgi:hypothetical protein